MRRSSREENSFTFLPPSSSSCVTATVKGSDSDLNDIKDQMEDILMTSEQSSGVNRREVRKILGQGFFNTSEQKEPLITV